MIAYKTEEMKMKKLVLTFGLILTNVFASFAQEVDMSLERHNFFYQYLVNYTFNRLKINELH